MTRNAELDQWLTARKTLAQEHKAAVKQAREELSAALEAAANAQERRQARQAFRDAVRDARDVHDEKLDALGPKPETPRS